MSEPGILPNPIPFGKYYLLERINVGGMAEVYKAKAFGVEGFERLLAVKKILSSIAEDEAFINMFIDEAKIAGQLSHPNIAQIFDLGKVDDSYFIALEYIGGKDLKTIFERARRLGEKVDIPRICYVVMKVCEGLAHAHEKRDSQGRDLNIVHRDISPQNVLLSYEGEVKIIDFGIAKAQGKTSQTQVGVLKGKFSYMSPEQVRGLHVDHRSDIFSLGIVLYELLTLERLFLGESDFDTLEKIRKVEMSPPSLYNPRIPKELEDIVLKALARSPDERFESASEFAETLERFMRTQNYYFTNKDLGAYMKEAFHADIEFENKKIEYYRSLNLQPLDEAPVSIDGPVAPKGGGLEWGEEEMETQIFDRPEPEGVNDADIVYAEDASQAGTTDELPTVEFDHFENEGFSFDEEKPQQRAGRKRQPTAKLEKTSSDHRTTAGVPAVRKKKSAGKSAAVILLVFGFVVSSVLLLFNLGLWVESMVFPKSPLTVETEPSSVEVWINDELVHDGETPFEYKLSPDVTKIELRRDGYVSFETTKTIDPDTPYQLTRVLEPIEKQVELLVKSDPPGATIELEGQKLDEPTPFKIKSFPDGADSVALTISKEDYFPEERTINLKDAPESLDVRLKPQKIDLKITSKPDRAEYTVVADEDEVASGRTPDTVKDLDATKSYSISIERRRHKAWTSTFEPGFDREARVEAKLEPEEDESSTVASSEVQRPPRDPSPQGDRPDPKPDPKPEPKPDPKPDPAPEPTGTGLITVASKPAARVYINDQDTGRYTPLMDFKIKSGRHKIILKNEEFGLDKTYYVDVKPGESKRIINRP